MSNFDFLKNNWDELAKTGMLAGHMEGRKETYSDEQNSRMED